MLRRALPHPLSRTEPADWPTTSRRARRKTSARVVGLGVGLLAGAVLAQQPPVAEPSPVAEPPPAETPATPPARSIEGTPPATEPGTPVDPAAPGTVDTPPATPPGGELLPDLPPGGLPFGARDIQRRRAIPYQEASTEQIEAQIEEAWDEVSDRRISLIEAVRVALLNDPLLRVAEQELAIAQAARTIARASFDPRLVGGITYKERHAELRREEVQNQQDQYNRNHQLILATRKERKQIERELEQLERGELPEQDTVEGQLQQELQEAALDILEQLGVDAGIDVSSLSRISDEIVEQGIQTRKDVIKILESTERNAIKQNDLFPVNSVRRTDTTEVDISILKQFRNGITIGPYLQYANAQTNLQRRAGAPRVNESEIGIELTIPLAQGRGTIAASGHELAAQIDVEASQLSLQHTVASRVLNVVTAYWNLAAAQEQLGYLIRSEVTSTALAALTSELIKADEVPAASASQAQARRAQSTANRIRGEITLQDAQQNLALAMGVGDEDIIFAPLAADRLPGVVPESSVKALRLPDLVEGAIVRRADYRASRKAIDSGRLLSEQARLNIKPRIDFNVGMFYTSLDQEGSKESFYSLYLENQAGPGFMVSLRMDWPFFLNDARGNYAIREADLEIRREQTRLLNNQIVSGISRAHFALRTSARELRLQQQAVSEYEQALATERERFRLGLATMLDPIQTEERLTLARAELVFSRLLHAQSLARLRFETGTLMPHDQAGRTSLERSTFVTLPEFGPPPLEDTIAPRKRLDEIGNDLFGETDPRRVLKSLDAREARAAARQNRGQPSPAPAAPARSSK